MTWWDNATHKPDTFHDDDIDDVMTDRKWSDICIDEIGDVMHSGKWSDIQVNKLTTEVGQTGFKPIRYWIKNMANNLDPPSAKVLQEENFQTQKLPNKMSQNEAKKTETKKDFGLTGFLRV